jgi:phosphate transport system ATP-binding protein
MNIGANDPIVRSTQSKFVHERPAPAKAEPALKARVENLRFFYGKNEAVKSVTLPIYENRITALIGPSGCGKTTLLRCFNRLHELYAGNRHEGAIRLFPENLDVLDRKLDPIAIRLRVSMVFQKPNPFPKSIFANIAYGLRLANITAGHELRERVESALRRAALWDEVCHRLDDSAWQLSGGQQQRLCIARAIAAEPEILLFDEPTSALDPVATAKIEKLLHEVAQTTTVIIVTHSMQQAARISDYTAFMYLGELVEFGPTRELFATPRAPMTENYISGCFG